MLLAVSCTAAEDRLRRTTGLALPTLLARWALAANHPLDVPEHVEILRYEGTPEDVLSYFGFLDIEVRPERISVLGTISVQLSIELACR
ncbi:uncharacterized protein LAESUDRAFT_553475 [Laetiporus sulphureus 93-53]|uniref:Uncharacterized protein n=1 Tax=Laetiporus sulphureus 93-53 TaxID=1314785 RepID=A0A165B8W6_9APHY|nr:uncharacterized protein LAESUDRAFT_553475 [Laetiporus sulphureus 93-53]KZT00511.1 hypothetical protein LAESUDRAFT_553475 [Laetiporus sulphureus 93-53]